MTEPERLPAKLVVETTAKAAQRVADLLSARLERAELRPEHFWAIVNALLVSAMQTLDAIYYLTAESQPKAFPAQAGVLIRSLLECLGNFLALAEDPDTRPGLFARDAYRAASGRHRELLERHGSDPEWTTRLRVYAEGLELEARTIGLSTDEAADPVGRLARWPTPGGLLGRHYQGPIRLSGEREAVFCEIYDAWYGNLSTIAHQRLAGLEKSVTSLSPSPQERRNLASDVLTSASFFLACLLSELEDAAALAPSARLREAWTYIQGRSREMWRVYEIRYERLLEKGNARDPADRAGGG